VLYLIDHLDTAKKTIFDHSCVIWTELLGFKKL